MTDALPTLQRTAEGKITFWSSAMERRYGFSKKEAVGQIADQLLKTVFWQTKDEIQTILTKNHLWSGGLVHHDAEGRAVLTANYWQAHLPIDDQAGSVTEFHADIMPEGAPLGSPLIELLSSIERELIESLTAISMFNAAACFIPHSGAPDSKHAHFIRLMAGQIARNAKAVHLLRDVVGALRDNSRL